MQANKQDKPLEDPTFKKSPSREKQGAMPPLKPIEPGPLSTAEVVNRLEDLVNFALECEGKQIKPDVSFVQVYKQLQEVRQAIDLLIQDQNKLVAMLNAAGQQQINIKPENLSPEDKKIVERIQRLKSLCEEAKDRIRTRTTARPQMAKEVEEKIEESVVPEKKKIARRKGRFRPLGGKKGWLPT